MNRKQIYFKSDFTVILASEAQWGGCPFRLSFYTASPSRAFVASFDGENWENCRLLDDGRLEVAINQKDGTIQTLMGIGTLMCAPEFYLDNDAFRDHICNEFVKPFAPVFIDTDGTEYNAVLDLNGSSTLVTIGTIPAFYQRGEKGERGERGEQGIQGVKGATGPKGETGPQGQQGIQGIQGPKGETGATGPQGERGLQGEKGEPFRYSDFTPEQLEGLRGPQGVQGETGPAGPVGPQGPQGERGPKGDSVTMFPAVTIFGQPTIQETQMSGFSAENYAQFPFMVDFAGRTWRIDFAITTGADVSQQHNIFDSAFGLAFAFKGGKFLLAMSSNGTSWNLGATSGTHTIAADTTYYIRITWDGTAYVLAYSTDKVAWTTDITVTSSESLAPKQVIIGKSLDSAYVFNGSINFAEARLTIANVIVWEGMEEVGTATRMALDMSNIDEAGKQRVNDIVKSGSFGAEVTALDLKVGEITEFESRIKRDLGYNDGEEKLLVGASADRKNMYMHGGLEKLVANDGFDVSESFDVDACSSVLFRTGYNPSDDTLKDLDISVISYVETRVIGGKPVEVLTPAGRDMFVKIPDSGYYWAGFPNSAKVALTIKHGDTPLDENGKVDAVIIKHGSQANALSWIAKLMETIDLKSFADGYYAGMRTGTADNLAARGEEYPVEFAGSRNAGGSVEIEEGTADVKSIKGKTIVWNQRFDVATQQSFFPLTGEGWTARKEDGDLILNGTVGTQTKVFNTPAFNVPLMNFTDKFIFITNSLNIRFGTASDITERVYNRTSIASMYLWATPGTYNNFRIKVMLVNLTQMYGAGNEPATAQEFAERLGYSSVKEIPYFEYNEGELRNNDVASVKCTGANLWDEQWESGAYSNSAGNKTESSQNFRNKSFVEVSPNTTYYVKKNGILRVYYYDADGVFISYATLNSIPEFTTPASCKYINFYFVGTKYNNDVCINKYDESFNGSYEPYTESVRALPTKKYFPEGLRSAGDAYDEMTPTKAITRIGIIVLDGMQPLAATNWRANENGCGWLYPFSLIHHKTHTTSDIYTSNNKLLDITYGHAYNQNEGISILPNNNNFSICIWKNKENGEILDTAAKVNAYLAANPITIYYELSEPIVEEYDELNLSYNVHPLGIESVTFNNTDGKPNVYKASHVYSMDAYNTIVSNRKRIEALEQALANIANTANLQNVE